MHIPLSTFSSLFLLLPILPTISSMNIPPPTGPCLVGRTFNLRFTDRTRLDPFSPITPRPHRSIAIHHFFPISKPGESKPSSSSPYLSDVVLRVLEDDFQIPPGTISQMRANSKDIPADARSKAKLQASAREGPIILFSHGLRATSVLHQTLIEDLVSHGWTVAALEHPYDAVGVQFADPDNKNNSEIIRSTVPAEYGDEILKEYLKVRVEDIGFAISALNARKVVVVGHSLGGSAAVEASLKWPKAIVGAVNMDGMMWIDEDTVEEGRKVLLMGAGEDPGRKGGWEEFMQAARKSKIWAREVSVKGVKHMGFSDLAWLGKLPFMEMIPALASYIEALGSADGDRMLEVAREWVRDFVDFSVGKKGSGKLVKGGSGNGTWVDGWEDVIFIGGN